MARAQNRHDTKKWKKRRKDHFGDKCDNAKCGICAAHKSWGNAKKAKKPKDLKKLEAVKFEQNEFSTIKG